MFFTNRNSKLDFSSSFFWRTGRAGPGRVGAGRFSAKMKKKSRQKSPQLPNKTQINQVWEWSNKPFKVSLFNLIFSKIPRFPYFFIPYIFARVACLYQILYKTLKSPAGPGPGQNRVKGCDLSRFFWSAKNGHFRSLFQAVSWLRVLFRAPSLPCAFSAPRVTCFNSTYFFGFCRRCYSVWF